MLAQNEKSNTPESLKAAKYESVSWDTNINPSRYFPTSSSFPLLFLRLSDALWKGWKKFKSSISDWKLLSFPLPQDVSDSNKLQEKSIWDFLIFSLSWPITVSSSNTLRDGSVITGYFRGSLHTWSSDAAANQQNSGCCSHWEVWWFCGLVFLLVM